MGVLEVIFGFKQAYTRRRELNKIVRNTAVGNNIYTINLLKYKQEGILALALDFDGVLANHGADFPLPDATAWLTAAAVIFGENRLFILSNKPTETRRIWFAHHFPNIRFISGVPKKPQPHGLKKIGELAQIPLSSILMVDDRLLTGCLAALNAGSTPCWINQPTVSFKTRPFAESFFTILRRTEQIILKLTVLTLQL